MSAPPADSEEKRHGLGHDRFVEAKRSSRLLFPALQNRTLARAANALREERIDVAESAVSKYVAKHGDDPEGLNLFADIARRKGEFEKAEELTAKSVELDPDSVGYRFNYAVILRRRNKFEDALAQLDVLLRRDPQNVAFRDQKAAVLRVLGRLPEVLTYRRELVQEYPDSAEAWLHYAHALRGVESLDQCIAAYHRVLELAPAMSEAYVHLANLKTYSFTPQEIESMEELLRNGQLPPDDRADLNFALGKAYGDTKLYAKSFENYAKGNALRRRQYDFDPTQLSTFRHACERLFTEQFFGARTGWGHDSSAPIFIVGLPRSGSTLIEQILSSHSQIEGLGELPELDVVVGERLAALEGRRPADFWIGGWFEFRPALAATLPRVLPQLSREEIHALGEAYLRSVQHRRTLGRPCFTDKALRNFGYAGLILLIFPKAKVIDARRHPLDCGWSCFKSDFPGGQPFANRLPDIGSHYANYVRLMAHFDRILPGRVHRLEYERLVAEPESEMRRLFDYLGLPFEEQCMRFYENKRAVATLSSEQVRIPLYRSGIAQWQHYDPWLGPLKAALGSVLESYSET